MCIVAAVRSKVKSAARSKAVPLSLSLLVRTDFQVQYRKNGKFVLVWSRVRQEHKKSRQYCLFV